jgi:hypothetical protein
MKKSLPVSKAFAKNRIEELGFDLWGEFVVPLYFEELSIDETRKSIIFEGGRGCGKTTLLRYLSHDTQFSPRRALTEENVPNQIGLYFRADTHYLRSFRGDAVSDEKWQAVFNHELCLSICLEVCGAIRNMSCTHERVEFFQGLSTLNISLLEDFVGGIGSNLSHLETFLKQQQAKLVMWLGNTDEGPPPTLLPFKAFLSTFIDLIRKQVKHLSDAVFFVFIDEYENLLPYQMRLINTHLKHAEPPLLFHVAVKRHGMATLETIGEERLQEPDDFRIEDIEARAAKTFDLFAAELLCFRLKKRGVNIGPPELSDTWLTSTENLEARRSNDAYRKKTLSAARTLLPGLSNVEFAQYILADQTLRQSFKKNLEKALKLVAPDIDAESFIKDAAPVETITTLALIYQKKKPNDILQQLDLSVSGQQSGFKSKEWNHHYFLATALYLFMALPRPCVLYAGFDNFLKLSRGNARHFLELCHQSIVDSGFTAENLSPITLEKQALAAHNASAYALRGVQSAGNGDRLYSVVSTLGQIFKASQSRPSQSEPERTHFSISDGELSKESKGVLNECIKWSVLYSNPETKVKSARFESEEYILNPIFAPHFRISFNKGRRLEIPYPDAELVLLGSKDDLSSLLKRYANSWELTELDQGTLFSSET